MAFRVILGAILLLACDEIVQPVQPEQPEIKIETKTVTLPAEGGAVAVQADIPATWSVKIGADWFAVNPSSGEAGTAVLEFSARKNDTGAAREDKAVLFADGLQSVTIIVNQQPSEGSDTPPDPPAQDEVGIGGGVNDWGDGNDIDYNEEGE